MMEKFLEVVWLCLVVLGCDESMQWQLRPQFWGMLAGCEVSSCC